MFGWLEGERQRLPVNQSCDVTILWKAFHPSLHVRISSVLALFLMPNILSVSFLRLCLSLCLSLCLCLCLYLSLSLSLCLFLSVCLFLTHLHPLNLFI